MSTKFNRPSASYGGAAALTNRQKYELDEAAELPFDPTKVDGDLNYAIDALNTLDDDIAGVVAGAIPGSSTPANANKLLTTDGAGTLSFTAVDSDNIDANGVNLDRIATGTTGEMITWGANNQPTTVAVGTAGQVMTSNGIGMPPSFQAAVTIPSGVLVPFAGSAAPSGWLLCYGQAVSRTTYATLFTAIGIVYGAGDASTTFNLPDLRGRGVFGVDNMGTVAASRITSAVSGLDGSTLGAAGGDQRMQTHTHVQDAHHHALGFTTQTGFAAAGGGSPFVNLSGSRDTNDTTATNQNTGAGSSQNVPPAIMLNMIIKT